VLPSLIAVLPTAGVLFLFWVGIRALVQADRRERQAQARIEAAERLDHERSAGRSAGQSADRSTPEGDRGTGGRSAR
jgi:hypothetical protein